MKIVRTCAPLMLLTLCSFAADAARIGTAPIMGPLVDVTLKSGESNKGQLLSFAGGTLMLKLDSGVVVAQDGTAIVSVRFIAPEKVPTAQETQLSPTEIRKLQEYRLNERKSALTKEEESDFKRLRGKTDSHIQALEREIKKATNEDDLKIQLTDLIRCYFLYGMQWDVIRGMIKIAGDSVENPALRLKAQTTTNSLISKIDEDRQKGTLKPFRPFEKPREKFLDKILDKPTEKP